MPAECQNDSGSVRENTDISSSPALTPSEFPNGSSTANRVQQGPRSPRSKIGRLPKAVRDRLNFMLRDGLKLDDVLANLGDDAKDITARNLSDWHNGPSYQHWLLEQDWLDSLRPSQESAFDLLNDFDVARFNEGALQLAVTRLFFAFRHLENGQLNEKLGGNARTFAGLVHALARACRETTYIEKYRDACSNIVAALQQKDPNRDLSDPDFGLLVDQMDRVFKIRRRRPPAPSDSTPAPKPKPLPIAPEPVPPTQNPPVAPTGPTQAPGDGATEREAEVLAQKSGSSQNLPVAPGLPDAHVPPHPGKS